jgi:hypothetical protein
LGLWWGTNDGGWMQMGCGVFKILRSVVVKERWGTGERKRAVTREDRGT